MIDAGADIVAPMCDNSALGVVEAAQEAGVYAVASGMGQNEVAPKAVLVTVVKNTGVAVRPLTKPSSMERSLLRPSRWALMRVSSTFQTGMRLPTASPLR